LRVYLSSIYQNSPAFRFEVYVVDNTSRDGSVKMVKEKFPSVKLLENKENRYFSLLLVLLLKGVNSE
jgi:hypothetical protein